MNISIIIPNYNGEALLKKNLPKVIHAIKKYKNGFVEIIIPDDGSTDNSLHQLEEIKKTIHYEKLFVIPQSKNKGFSSNVNIGVKHSSGDLIILLNTDVVPEAGFLEKVVTHFQDNTVFAVAFTDKSIEKDGIVIRGRGIARWHRGFLIHSRGEPNKSNTLWANGGSSAFRKEIWDALGGFFTIYDPFYWEDIDLSYRALKSGYKIVFDPEIVVVHEHDKGAIKTNYSSYNVRKTAYRNGFYFVWLNITDIVFLLNHIIWIGYYFMKDSAYIIGFFDALRSLPLVLRLRSKNIKKFITRDKSLLSQFIS